MSRRSRFPDLSTPTRREIVHDYIERFDERDASHAHGIADSIDNSRLPLAQHLVLIPVAAHQEKLQIQPALAQYARQETKQPFSIVLGLNSPSSEEGNPEIDALIKEVELAKDHYPHLDIRTSTTYYDNPTIGMIRRDLWNGALLAAMDQGAYTQDETEYIGINHDIDTISINPRYVHRIQEHYQKRQRAHDNAGMASIPLSCRSTITKHAPSSEYPMISKGVYWIDFFHRQMNTAYEAGMVFPLSYYADKAGFDAQAKTHEAGSIFDTGTSHVIPGTTMHTSPRRYIDRLKYGYDQIWTPDSFSAHDNCRSFSTPATDLTIEELEATITKDASIRQTISLIATRAIHTALSQSPEFMEPTVDDIDVDFIEQKVNRVINRKLYLTTAVLERVVESPRLAKQARSLYGDSNFVMDITDQLMGITD